MALSLQREEPNQNRLESVFRVKDIVYSLARPAKKVVADQISIQMHGGQSLYAITDALGININLHFNKMRVDNILITLICVTV